MSVTLAEIFICERVLAACVQRRGRAAKLPCITQTSGKGGLVQQACGCRAKKRCFASNAMRGR